MNESLNICLPCGICCNGTMIGFVQLEAEELPVMRELMDITETNGEGFFLEPCKKLSTDGCTIYSQRPKHCDNFNCKLLKSLQQKEIEFDSAMEIINEVKQKRLSIEKQLAKLDFELQYPSFHFKILELKKMMRKNKSESSITQNHPQLISEIEELDNLLSKSFGVSLF